MSIVILLILSLLFASAGGYLYYSSKKQIENVTFEVPPEILSSFNFFQTKVEALNLSCAALDNLANEYFVTLTHGGYSELINLKIDLNVTLNVAKELLAAGNIEELSLLLDFVFSDSDKDNPPPSLNKKLLNDKSLLKWQTKTEQTLKRIETILGDVSDKYKAAGRTKKRERVATDTVLGEVRKAMLTVAKKNNVKP